MVCIKFTRDGRLIAFAEGYTVKFWEVATGRELPALNAPNSGLFTTQGRVFASFSDDGKKSCDRRFRYAHHPLGNGNGKQLVKMSGRTNMAKGRLQCGRHKAVVWRPDALGPARRPWRAHPAWSIRQLFGLPSPRRQIPRNVHRQTATCLRFWKFRAANNCSAWRRLPVAAWSSAPVSVPTAR